MRLTFFRQGFTLLELMVTLVIVLIITVIAVPAMSRYIVQSKVSDAIVAASSMQSMVVKNIANLESVTNSGVGIALPSSLGRYVSTFSLSNNGVISITTTSTAGAVTLTLSPSYSTTTELVTWVCAVSNSAMNENVPSKCRI
jgi:type IV pilus assembly protein PilA